MEPVVTKAVELHDLSRRYGALYVLRDINLTVSAGKTVVLRGGNGAGKTTFLRLLSSKLRPSRGGGKIFGHDLVKEAAQVRSQIAYLTVLGGSYGTLSALENLDFAAKLYGKRLNQEVLVETLEQVGLGDARDKLTRTFSSGMKKRLGVARLLLSDANLWLLDEPYAALDENGKSLIDDLLVKAKTEGKTVMMASHDLARSARFADSILELKQGQLFASASVEMDPEEVNAKVHIDTGAPAEHAQKPKVAHV